MGLIIPIKMQEKNQSQRTEELNKQKTQNKILVTVITINVTVLSFPNLTGKFNLI